MSISRSQIENGRIRLSNGQRWVAYPNNGAAWEAAKRYNRLGWKTRDGARIAKKLEEMKKDRCLLAVTGSSVLVRFDSESMLVRFGSKYQAKNAVQVFEERGYPALFGCDVLATARELRAIREEGR
jgi:hypothetical protein